MLGLGERFLDWSPSQQHSQNLCSLVTPVTSPKTFDFSIWYQGEVRLRCGNERLQKAAVFTTKQGVSALGHFVWLPQPVPWMSCFGMFASSFPSDFSYHTTTAQGSLALENWLSPFLCAGPLVGMSELGVFIFCHYVRIPTEVLNIYLYGFSVL